MAFGVYIHIPYCLQRCVYCDFATYEFSQILPPEQYVGLVKKEILSRAPSIGPKKCATVYFGGGTPSLLEPELLKQIMDTLKLSGFVLDSETEVTLEINPATVKSGTVETLMDMGFNRFSLGAQTFDDSLLKLAHRKHTAEDTRQTLELFKRYRLNYSVDILFALPGQTKKGLEEDLNIAMSYEPNHVSPYCLTVPDTNPMAKARPLDEIQLEMFDLIRYRLENSGIKQYEISNYAVPGKESRHNLLYWQDSEYWGVGLSAHSYLKTEPWGTRFWNSRGINDYQAQIESEELPWEIANLKRDDGERLTKSESMTDFVHTALRLTQGLSLEHFKKKFGECVLTLKSNEFSHCEKAGWLKKTDTGFALTPNGQGLSNEVFRLMLI